MTPDLLLAHLSKRKITGPVRLDAGSVIIDWERFLQRQESCLEGLKTDSAAYKAVLDRLQDLYDEDDQNNAV